jgi:hypothetical protein
MNFQAPIYFDYYVTNENATALVEAGKFHEAMKIYLEIICKARQDLQYHENDVSDFSQIDCSQDLFGSNFANNSVHECPTPMTQLSLLPILIQSTCNDQFSTDLVPPNGFALCDCLFVLEVHHENIHFDVLKGIFVATVFNLAMSNVWQYLSACNDQRLTCRQLNQSLSRALKLFSVVHGTLQNPEIMANTVQVHGSKILEMVVVNNIGYIYSIYCHFDAVEESLRLLRRGLSQLYLLERTNAVKLVNSGWVESRLFVQDFSILCKTIVTNAQCLCHQYLLGAPMA